MSTIDVRNQPKSTPVDTIQFADETTSAGYCTIAYLKRCESSGIVAMMDEDHEMIHCDIVSKQHALDFIAAIEKAIELGWLK